LVFWLLLLEFVILLMRWLLSVAGKDGASSSNTISPQQREPLQISTRLSTHSVLGERKEGIL
jgi:hypothetical protein